jgi:hypothetical protein
LFGYEEPGKFSLTTAYRKRRADEMDHIVYVDAKAKELSSVLDGSKLMIIRGATGRKLPYGRVFDGDTLYFVENNSDGIIKAKANVTSVFNSEKLTEDESSTLVSSNQPKLKLTELQMKRWAGKRYIVLVEIADVSKVEPFRFDKSNYGNMDDWLPVEDIKKVKVND